ncbi:PglZ domain protein [Anaeromyxobacter dehalogenans 2CP-1]|uniref:PglZ domain protein n=1 Tax=Anaeromyxobacter dehalogenans (strain ATCC BAA-258 / DSM 21875 / 2CP-1) TaxID=455488 RepID=B8JFR4_ANAD2|nr:BREX-6 system phosphatase PglZ [Anaeromyxobacter dehalogenans]ACL64502.1 PglZ domain protein [Anaeromyxobacter dehalogenans 2CP-1]
MTGGLTALALEQELLGELRRRGVVVWLDAHGTYTPFVDGLSARAKQGEFPFPVVAFRGSFLEIVLALEPYGSGLDNAPLLIHMPAFTEDSIRATPVLELYEPGFRFRKDPKTLVREVARGRVAPDALEQYLAGAGTVDLAAADAWLASQLTHTREGLAALLEQLGPTLVLDALVDVLERRESFLLQRVGSDAEREVLEAWLARQTGMDAAWLRFYGSDPKATPLASVAGALVGWLLSVEYVHDLNRPPFVAELVRLRDLSAPLVKASLALVDHIRGKHTDSYASLADEVELHLHEELPAIRPEDLGKIDTFRKEEQRVLQGAVDALRAGEWEKVRGWAEARNEERSYWLRRDPARRRAWELAREAAALGSMLTARPRPLEGVRSLDAAVERYAATAYEVDRAHRRFEQRQATLLDSQLPHFGDLKEIVRVLRSAYRGWADRLARDFAAACRAAGFLPDATLQQRAVFEQVVQPLATDERVALFLLDAFRYEMATELLAELKAPGTVVDLKARLAELPTITAVGMNALAPVSQGGRLQVSGTFGGFRTGEFTVRTPDDRARAIGLRTGAKQSVLLQLGEVCELEPEKLKRKIASARVVVVHGTEIDDAGEANLGPATFEIFLRQLRTAFAQLQKAGVKSFVFTADHGFLLLDETTQKVPYGSKRDPAQRYVLDEHPRAEQGMVNVSLSALGYDGLAGYLLFREDTAVFATGNAGATFVHGGNSPQERIIPVLTVRRERPLGRTLMAYRVDAERLPDAMGLRRVRVRLRAAHDDAGQLGFVAAPAVSVGMRAPGHPEVRATLKGVSGPGAVEDGTLRLAMDADWTEVFFALEGPSSEAVRLEVYHPDAVEKVAPKPLDGWFDVDWRRGSVEPVAPQPERVLDWSDALPAGGVRAVFEHLAVHGAITETEVTRMLGSPRAFRRFSLDFDEHVRKVPFRIRTEPGSDGKRYVKEGER